MPAERPMMKSNENRRSNKPIMEKRRRARINNCLNELKALILEALKKDPARHSKLEKADILEMTVKHLQNLQRQQVALQAASNPNVTNKFRAGYHECANEVSRYLKQIDGLDTGSQQRLLNHLSNCIEFINRNEYNVIRTTTQPLSIRVTSYMEASRGQLTPLPTPNVGGGSLLDKTPNAPIDFHLVPTRVVNGELSVVLPAGASAATACTLVRNGMLEVNERCSVVSNVVDQTTIMSPSPFQCAERNSLVRLGRCPANKPPFVPPPSSPVDLCGGSGRGKEQCVVTSQEPWRPW